MRRDIVARASCPCVARPSRPRYAEQQGRDALATNGNANENTPESRLNMQTKLDLWLAQQNAPSVEPLEAMAG